MFDDQLSNSSYPPSLKICIEVLHNLCQTVETLHHVVSTFIILFEEENACKKQLSNDPQ